MTRENILDLCSMSEENTRLLNILYEKYKNEYVVMLGHMS